MSELKLLNALSEIQAAIEEHQTVIIEFGASWCRPCIQFEPHFTRFASLNPDLFCVKVDIDVDEKVVEAYKIQSVPQVMAFVNGEYVKHLESRTIVKLNEEIGLLRKGGTP